MHVKTLPAIFNLPDHNLLHHRTWNHLPCQTFWPVNRAETLPQSSALQNNHSGHATYCACPNYVQFCSDPRSVVGHLFIVISVLFEKMKLLSDQFNVYEPFLNEVPLLPYSWKNVIPYMIVTWLINRSSFRRNRRIRIYRISHNGSKSSKNQGAAQRQRQVCEVGNASVGISKSNAIKLC